MILYRGTPEPERHPKPREYAAVFFTPEKRYAATYGPWVHTYEVGKQRILDSASPEAFELVRRFTSTGTDFDQEPVKQDVEELFFHPIMKLVRFLSKYGYTGTEVGGNIGLWDLKKVRLLDRAEYEEIPDGSCRYRKVPKRKV